MSGVATALGALALLIGAGVVLLLGLLLAAVALPLALGLVLLGALSCLVPGLAGPLLAVVALVALLLSPLWLAGLLLWWLLRRRPSAARASAATMQA